MKAFWLLVLVLVLGAGAMLLLPGVGGTHSGGAAPVPSPTQSGADATPGSAPVLPVKPLASVPEQIAPTPAATADESTPNAAKLAAAMEADLQSAISGALGPKDVGPGKVPAGGSPISLPVVAAHPSEKIAPAKAVRLADGSILLDGQHKVTGSGTKADPYVVDFELLMSASQTYQPRSGLTKLPERVTFLHDSWVKLVGYVAFPIAAQDPKELLVMFNQWDGCCLGVPPTAYDAVEVKLEQSVSGSARFATHGSLLGKMKIDPYVDSNFLLGLYVMEDATLVVDKIDSGLQKKHEGQN
jgi:hypothetical protein